MLGRAGIGYLSEPQPESVIVERLLTERGPTHDDGSILEQPGSTQTTDNLVHLKAVQSTPNGRAYTNPLKQ